jgi:hypothetical protein
MTIQYSTEARNAGITALTDDAGPAPSLQIRSGPPPVNCAAPPSGTLLATLVLPDEWLAPASDGIRSLVGLWQDPLAAAGGLAGHFRLMAGSVCKAQGTITVPGGGGDMTMTNPNVVANEPVTITSALFGIGGA